MAARAAAAKPNKLHLVQEPLRAVDGAQVLAGLRSSLVWLQTNQEQINDLNVFPVPDGDTGSNMYLTLRGALEEAEHCDHPDVAGSVLGAAAHGSLMGARGNSGVILSQVLRGLASGAGGAAVLDAALVARALSEGSAVAYKAVIKPTEGTILTVVRKAAEAAQAAAAESDDIRVVLDRATGEAHAAVEKTTEQLAVLAEAGVVDAGGFGFAVILEGFARAIEESGENASPAPPPQRGSEPRVIVPGAQAAAAVAKPRTARRGAAAVAAREEGWGYCTEFLMHDSSAEVTKVREQLSEMGESALIVGDQELIRVHIHTTDPAALIAKASGLARLSKMKVEDMTAQHHDVLDRAEAAEASEPAALAVVAVAPGDGFAEILTSLGCAVIVEGGQTINPSIENLVDAVRRAHAKSVILLPNNGNVILTAQQVNALLPDVEVAVVPSRSLPQGISSLLAYDPTGDAVANADRMNDAMKQVHAVEVTRAVRDTAANGLTINVDDVIALVDGEIKTVGDDEHEVVERTIRELEHSPEIVTVYAGLHTTDEQSGSLVERLQSAFPGVQFETHRGGQDHYAYILSVE
jgi:fatty acid kinase